MQRHGEAEIPRDGSGTYTLPAGSTVTNGDTSDASDINTPLADLETDMNTARPVSTGGTGQTSVANVQAAFKIPPFDGTATVSGSWTVSGAWTITGNMTFNDNVKARFGTGNDLEIYHNGSNSFITDAGTGALVIGGSIVQIVGTASEILFRATAGGASELRHNNNTKAVTTLTGFTVTGLLSGDTIGGAMVSTSISTDTGSTTKVPNVAAVEAAIAAAATSTAVGAVGTYAMLFEATAGTAAIALGGTAAGSTLEYNAGYFQGSLGNSWQTANAAGTGANPAGTWRLMGHASVTSSVRRGGIWLRIS